MKRIERKSFQFNPTSWWKVLLENYRLCDIVCFVTSTCERFMNPIL